MSQSTKYATATERIAQAMSSRTGGWSVAREKIEAMRRFYLRIDRDDELNAVLASLVRNAVSLDVDGRRLEGQFLVVIGASGAGKTSILKKAFADLSGFDKYRELAGTMLPLLSVEAYRPASSKALATTILGAMGVPVSLRSPSRVAWDMVRANLELRQVVLLHIDEAQHCLRDGDAEAQLARDELKGLAQGRWPVSIVLSGLPSLEGFVKSDSQIMRRSSFFPLKPLDRAEDIDLVSAVLSELTRRAGLSSSFPGGYDVVDRLVCAGCMHLGRVVKIVVHAAQNALGAGETTMTIGHLVRAFEDITLCGEERNPFLCEGYDRIVHWPDDLKDAASVTDRMPSQPKKRVRR